jgi:hypothetical protein
MASRRSNAPATETPAETPTTTGFEIPDAWGPAEDLTEFDSHNAVDKNDLIGVPFLIIGAQIERNDGKDYDVAWVYALNIHGVEFEFSDTSRTGVCGQIQAILVEQGMSPTPNEPYQALPKRIIIRQGLRASDFTTTNKKGAEVDGKTWYLTGRSTPRS